MQDARLKTGATKAAAESLRLLDHGFRAHDDDNAVFGDRIPGAIGFEIVTDDGAFGQLDVAVNDRAADAAVAADRDVVKDDGLFHFAIAVDADVVTEDGFLDAAAGKDRTAGNNGIERYAHAVGIGEDGLHRRILPLPAVQ